MTMENVTLHNQEGKETIFVNDLRTIVSAARDASYRMANLMQVAQNWLIGRRIVEQEQQGKIRAEYGKHVVELASQVLTKDEDVHATYPRNKNIAFVFYKAGFIESWGRGWKKICDGFVSAGLPKPTIESKQGGVLVTFQRNNVNLSNHNPIDAQNVAVNVAEELTKRQQNIIRLIEDCVAQNVAVNTKYLSEKLNVNRKTIQRDMAYLQERKLIQWIGPDKTGQWKIIKEK